MSCTDRDDGDLKWFLVPLKTSSCKIVEIPSNVLVTLGRGRNCTVSCPGDPHVSKMHCTLMESIDGKSIEMQDYSLNGIRLNGLPLQKSERHRVGHGDVLSLSWPAGGPFGEVNDGFTQFRVECKRAKQERQHGIQSIHMVSEIDPVDATPAAKRLRTTDTDLFTGPKLCKGVGDSTASALAPLRGQEHRFSQPKMEGEKTKDKPSRTLETGSFIRPASRRDVVDTSASVLFTPVDEERRLSLPKEEGETNDGIDSCSQDDQAQRRFRSQVRKMFTQALASESTGTQSATRIAQSSAELEVALLRWYGGTAGPAYRQHARMLKTNLSAVGNAPLRVKIISAQLSSDEVVLMSSADLAPSMLQEQRREIIRTSMRESVLPSNEGNFEVAIGKDDNVSPQSSH